MLELLQEINLFLRVDYLFHVQDFHWNQLIAPIFIFCGEQLGQNPHKCLRVTNMMAPIHYKLVKVCSPIWVKLSKCIILFNLIYFSNRVNIFSIKVIINHIEFFNSQNWLFWHDLPKCEIKWTNLPLLVARKKVLWVLMAHF